MLDLDAKLIKFTQEYRSSYERCTEKESEIEKLQEQMIALNSDVEDIEMYMISILKEIKTIKKRLLEGNVCAFSNDQFINDFIRASYFCNIEGERPVFQYVNITENQLQASDTHRLIVIKCPCIPDELKNSKIMLNVRDNFKDHINTDIEYPNIDAVIPQKEGYDLFTGVSSNNFYKLFNTQSKPLLHDNGVMVNVDFAGVKICFNKDYLDTALLFMGGNFDLYVKGALDPLIIENKDTMIVVCPMALDFNKEGVGS